MARLYSILIRNHSDSAVPDVVFCIGDFYYQPKGNDMKNKLNKETLAFSFRTSLPVMAGYIVLGTGFGILLAEKGYPAWWALIMSVTIYAGSMQYIGADLLSGGATIIVTALMTLMVNARHLFYGISMLGKYKDTGKAKPYLIFALTDETYSLVCDAKIPDKVDRNTFYLLVSAMNQCYWIIGSVIGAVVGNALAIDLSGIDFSMTALFVIIIVEQWESSENHLSAIIGALTAIVCLLIFGADNFLIPTMIFITIGLFVFRRFIESNTAKEAEKND